MRLRMALLCLLALAPAACVAVPPPPPVPIYVDPVPFNQEAFSAGWRDHHAALNLFSSSMPEDYRRGAAWWLHRYGPENPHLQCSSGDTHIDFQQGCWDAQRLMERTPYRLGHNPSYRQGWDSVTY